MEGSWQWAAFGKHPVAKDFFRVGQSGPLAKDFSQWVDRGYQLLGVRKKSSFCSWRFWTRGPKRDVLGCGVVRDDREQGRGVASEIASCGPAPARVTASVKASP